MAEYIRKLEQPCGV